MKHKPSENLEQLCDAIVALRLVDEAVEDVVDLLANVRPKAEKFAVDAVQGGLQELTFARVLAVKQLEELQKEKKKVSKKHTFSLFCHIYLKNKLLVKVLLGDDRLKVRRLEKAQKELVDVLQMGPGRLQRRLVLLGVELIGVGGGRENAKDVYAKLKRREKKGERKD